MITNPHLLPKVRSRRIMDAVGGKYSEPFPCALRLCSFVPTPCAPRETVVACHLPIFGKGTATKVTDMAIAAGCRKCHALLDMTDSRAFAIMAKDPGAWWKQILRANHETLARLIQMGLIQIPQAELI